MRASPAFQISVKRFGVWRAGVLGLSLLASTMLVAWLLSRDEFTPLGWKLAVGLAGLALLLAAANLARIPPMSLRWDTRQWHLGPLASSGEEPWSGGIAVALDLGVWLLLRFEHEARTGRRRFRWLPIQRAGLEAQWHALRCAVYCSRPVSGIDAGAHPAIAKDSKNERP